ncbi:uncharacterized protein LOC143215555 [Lasioglossum baleicum]|uniref:uncharacterized protein LOC143215555 n=1 Tax=Lasioglossum baleicum TaxID=434251 RepID=UPI003FCE4793
MEAPTWTVVQFIEDGSAEAVPTNWVERDKCYWPLLPQNKVRKAIKNSVQRNNGLWSQHHVKMFRNGTFEDYAEARAKAKALGKTSDQQLEMEAGCSKRKMEQPLSLSRVGDSSDEEILDTSSNNKKHRTMVTPDPVDPDPVDPDSADPGPVDPDPVDPNAVYQKMMLTHSEEDPLATSRDAEENESVQQQSSSGKQDEGYCCNACCRRDEQMSIIVQQNQAIQTLLTDVLQQIETKNNIIRTMSTDIKTPFFQRFWGLQFPLNTEEQLAEFQELLDTSDNFYDAVEEVYRIGGSHCYEFVKRTLATLLTDELALSYSWLGRKGKKPFRNTNIANLIICAAEKAKASESHKQTETAIQLWLKRAVDRMKRVTNKF